MGSIGDKSTCLPDTLQVDKVHSEETKLGSVPELVAELSVTFHTTNVHIDISA